MTGALRWLLARVLPYPGRFRWALAGAKLARPVAGLLPARLRAMVELAPKSVPPVSWMDDPQVFPAARGSAGWPGGADDGLCATGAGYGYQRGDDPGADAARASRW